MAGLLDEPYIGYPQLRRRSEQSLLGGTPRGLLNTTPSADTLRKLGEQLINIPTSATRAITDPQLFSRLLGITPNQQLSGFSAGYAGLPAKPPSDIGVVDPRNIDYSKGYSSGEEMGMMTALAAPLAPLARPVGRAVGEQAYRMTEDMLQRQGLMPSITAYHGTPYNIKGGFDISKVGTGEGAQSYGHGMYYAENPSVAESYRKQLSNFEEPFIKFGKNKITGSEMTDLDLEALKYLERGKRDAGQFPHNTVYYAKQAAKDNPEVLQKLNEFGNDVNFGYEKNRGNLYKVDIPDKDIPNMLDWDKPLSKQPKEVQDALKGIESRFPEIPDFNLRNWMDTDPLASTWHNVLARDLGLEQKEIASILKENGIKGIKYADELSRGKDKGTSNFVVFEPKDVKILEKNSQKVESLLD